MKIEYKKESSSVRETAAAIIELRRMLGAITIDQIVGVVEVDVRIKTKTDERSEE